MVKTDILLEDLVVEHEEYQQKIFELVKKVRVEKITPHMFSDEFLSHSEELRNIEIKYLVIDSHFCDTLIRLLEKWIDLYPNISLSIESILTVLRFPNCVKKFNLKKILDVDKCIENLTLICIYDLIEEHRNQQQIVMDFIDKNNIDIIGDFRKITYVLSLINADNPKPRIIYDKIKTGRFDIKTSE